MPDEGTPCREGNMLTYDPHSCAAAAQGACGGSETPARVVGMEEKTDARWPVVSHTFICLGVALVFSVLPVPGNRVTESVCAKPKLIKRKMLMNYSALTVATE